MSKGINPVIHRQTTQLYLLATKPVGKPYELRVFMTEQIQILTDTLLDELDAIGKWFDNHEFIIVPDGFESDYRSALKPLQTLMLMQPIMQDYIAFMHNETENLKTLGKLISETDQNLSLDLDNSTSHTNGEPQ